LLVRAIHEGVSSGAFLDHASMPQNFIACDSEQELLLPPNLKEWLPEDHLAWFVLAAVEEMDVSAFLAAYRADGHGRPAHEPAMMLALLLYASRVSAPRG
jgi:transposase